MSHRQYIYMFPYEDTDADYVLLDVTSDIYPYSSSGRIQGEVKRVLLSGHYGVLAGKTATYYSNEDYPAGYLPFVSCAS